MTDVLIIGAGPAGLTAAIYASRAGMSVKVFDKNAYGGQIVLTSEVDNYPGLQGINGVDFATSLYNHAITLGAEVVFEEVTSVNLTDTIKKVTTSSGVVEGHSIIVAGGANYRKLGCPGENKFTGRGVSYCATCDGAFFRNKTVAIVGGGNTALEDALFLANNCKKVYLIHRRDEFRGEKIQQDAVRSRENIEILYSSQVVSIEGDNKVEYCIVNTPSGEKKLDVDGVFVAVGLVPTNALYKDTLPLTPEGYIAAGEDCKTPIPGVFVAGDLRSKTLRQIITAASDGAVAAVAAAEYSSQLKKNS